MAIFRDATSGLWLPQDAGQWAEFVRGTPCPVADTLQLCQEPSGSLADSISTFTFTPSGTVAYQQTLAAFSQKAVQFTDGTSGSFVNSDTGLPDILTASLMAVAIGSLLSTPAAARSILELGTTTQVRYGPTATPRNRVTDGANPATGTVDPSTSKLWAIQKDRTNSATRGYSDVDTLTPTFSAAPTGKRMRIGGSGATPPAFGVVYHYGLFGANAELSPATVALLFQLHRQGPVTTNLVFDLGALTGRAVWFARPAAPPANTVVQPVAPDAAPSATPPMLSLGAGPRAAPPWAPRSRTEQPIAPDLTNVMLVVGLAPPRARPAETPRSSTAAPIAPGATLVFVGTVGPRAAPPGVPHSSIVAPIFVASAAVAFVPLTQHVKLATDPRPAWRPTPMTVAPFPPVTIIPGIGPAGAATFVLSLEAGSKVVYSWLTDIQPTYAGLEWRSAGLGAPKQRYEGPAYLTDADDRFVRGSLVYAAAQGSPFLLALPFEELPLVADATGPIVHVPSTAACDWALPGQRVVCVGPDNSIAPGVVQTSGSTMITLDVAPGGAGARGGRIMPAMAIDLDAQQGFARYQVNADVWNLKAQALLFGFGGLDSMGVGATLTTFGGRYVWDLGDGIEGQTAEAIDSLAERLDLGTTVAGLGTAAVANWGRTLRVESSDWSDFQTLKAFLFAVRGKQVAFFRPTHYPDAVFVANPGSAQLVIATPPTPGAGNFAVWFTHSAAHRQLAVTKADGTVQYVSVLTFGDNGDGTGTMNLSATVTGVVAKISFLEIVRFDSDDLEVSWDGATLTFEQLGKVVQQ